MGTLLVVEDEELVQSSEPLPLCDRWEMHAEFLADDASPQDTTAIIGAINLDYNAKEAKRILRSLYVRQM